MIKTKKFKKDKQAPKRRLYVKSISLDNFKSFKENSKIDLAPKVNLVFGQNSAGKSSIFQALRLFRQSYSPGGNMSVLNYEAPAEYRGKGGLDIDIGFDGIINDRDIKKSLELGVEIGTYNKSEDIIENEGGLKYQFEYVSNFYRGKNLIKNKTIPSKIKFSDGKNFISIDFVNHKFFKEDDDKFESLRDPTHALRRFQRRITVIKERSPYGAIYDPFFFKTKINKKETKLKTIDEIYDAFEKVKKEKIIKILLKAIQKLNQDLLEKLKGKKEVYVSYAEKRAKTKDIKKKMRAEFFSKKMDPEKRLDWILNNSKDENNQAIGDAIDVFNEEFTDNILFSGKKTILKFVNKMKSLYKFLGKKNINKKIFYDYFLSDIIKENKNLIFFNGEFKEDPSIKKKPEPFFLNDSEDASKYMINIFGWLFFKSDEHRYNENYVNVLGIYDGSTTKTHVGKDIMFGVDASMKKMIIVPGLRNMPKRYFVKGMQTNYVGAQAENLAELLANPKIQKEANEWLKKLEIPYNVNIQSSGNYYEIVFQPSKSKINIAQTHIGLGYPLVLPLIVQSLISRNKIIVVEEPEVHLHPKIEADLAELIVFSSVNYNNQFLIETHSEEFLLRILKNIREKKIQPKDISINYISNDRIKGKNTGSIINKIKVNSYGQYQTPWKDDLFAERRKEFK